MTGKVNLGYVRSQICNISDMNLNINAIKASNKLFDRDEQYSHKLETILNEN